MEKQLKSCWISNFNQSICVGGRQWHLPHNDDEITGAVAQHSSNTQNTFILGQRARSHLEKLLPNIPNIFFKEILDDLLELKELTGLLNAPVVFAHNDLLCGNIMLNGEEGKLYFIAFECGSYNYRHTKSLQRICRYPSKDEQYHFFRHYLMPDKPQEVSDKDLEALYIGTNRYKLASHLFWALWGLIQAKMSPINFDYMEYFFLWYKEFKRQKQSSISLAKSYLTGS